jgi:hypothetical protein
MPKSSGKSTTTYDQGWASLPIFDPVDLMTGEDIERAVNILEDSLNDHSIPSIIQVSLRHTHNYALEFILSCMFVLFVRVDFQLILVAAISETHATRISVFLLKKFPTNIEAFYECITYHVISRLSHTFRNLPFTSAEKPAGLDEHFKHETMALTALDELRKLLQDKNFYQRDFVTKTNKRSPHSADLQGVIQRFETLGLRFPKTRHSAEETVQKIMETQRRILKVIRHRYESSASAFIVVLSSLSFSSERFGTVKSRK